MINFSKHLQSRKRFSSLKLKNKKLSRDVSKIFEKIIKKKINFTKIKDLKKLSIDDIKKIDKEVRNKYQKTFVRLIKPEIESILKVFFSNEKINIRVGCQSKYRWEADFKKKKYFNIHYKDYKKGLKEPLSDDLLLKPTPAHQDLSNNGFRSSSVLIFYFQITPVSKFSSLLTVGTFKNKVGIFSSFTNKDNYANVIKDKYLNNIKFKVSKELKPDSILIMDSMTPHKSSVVAKFPRLALNVKIQPTSLNYLYRVNEIKKSFTKKNSIEERLNLLEKDLLKLTKKNNSLFYELAILNFIKKDYTKMKKNLKKMLLFKPSNKLINTFIAGGLFRKSIEQVNSNDLKKIKAKKYQIVKNSCAHAILNTLKLD